MSSTMIAANTTGIPVFVTGGIGGVHRGAQSSEFFFFFFLQIMVKLHLHSVHYKIRVLVCSQSKS